MSAASAGEGVKPLTQHLKLYGRKSNGRLTTVCCIQQALLGCLKVAALAIFLSPAIHSQPPLVNTFPVKQLDPRSAPSLGIAGGKWVRGVRSLCRWYIIS
jgi:hypothetical protein